ncbi:patellin-3 [Corylus avellana]|uniref:patellin-3 n=1 Tax=Corylus avellana TaxID=13451 RepID=UPI001E23AF35|nr:patellin-3 [Corylus avellana]
MADETPNPHPEPPPSDQPTDKDKSAAPVQASFSVVVTESASEVVTEKEESQPQPPPVVESGPPAVVEEAEEEKEEEVPPEPPVAAAEAEAKTSATKEDGVAVGSELPESKQPESLVKLANKEIKALEHRKTVQELKQLVQEAINSNRFTFAQPPQTKQEITPAAPSEPTPRIEENPEKEAQEVAKEAEEVSIWGVPLLKDDRTDVILLKFLQARDFKVKDAFVMISNTLKWRKEFGIDALVDEDLGDEWDKVVFMHGCDRNGHPVCYNAYGEFQNKDVYAKAFEDDEKRSNFLRWRIQFLEKSIRKLDFSPGGISTIFQVNDLKNSPGPGKRELRLATKQALHVLQDNYPEFVAKQVFINVPWWYLAFYTMISPFLTMRTKSKFIFAGPSKSAATLFKYVSPEFVPVQYGGLSVDYCDCNPEFSLSDPVTAVTVKPATKQTVEIIIYEKCILVWELRVVGWEVSYSAEFVPNAEDGYTVVIHKARKKTPTDEPVVSNSFKVAELGKILLTVDNPTSKKKNLLYRFKIKSFLD